jgi:hypothetical protein
MEQIRCRMIEFIWRIKHMAIDFKRQLTAVWKSKKNFKIQLNESTHVDKSSVDKVTLCFVYLR